jgi:lipopolysaccharide export system permease protein
MRVVKKLHIFILQSFLPLFAMTFFIVLFIVLMQFLWKYIDDLVGKGLSPDVLGELFFYAAVSLVPMALPLSILLASLMTFGNLGEHFELTALKASGISLLKVMAPLIVLISGVAIGAFFFQNNVLPKAQVKMWTLLFSMKQKSPELEIPEGVFYDQITGYNLFVAEKNRQTGMLKDVMIYDVSKGEANNTILLSDSARLAFTPDMKYLYLHMFQGEQFENLRDQSDIGSNVPFRREKFLDKELLIPFDANFNRMDDDAMRKQYVGKNIAELRQTIDSVGKRVDSIGYYYSDELLREPVVGIYPSYDPTTKKRLPYKAVNMPKGTISLDSIIPTLTENIQRQVFTTAESLARNKQNDYEFKSMSMTDDLKNIRRHQIELIKKFTLSVACLIFFFIGAPLGAIIRKGGLGTPLVISVLLFLVYYIIDNTGYKMARDGRWMVEIGMWLSTSILAPLGIYVTYKAMNDSAVFDKDAYLNLFRRLIGSRETRVIEYKEVIINEISTNEAISRLQELSEAAASYVLRYNKPQSYITYWFKGYDMHQLHELSDQLELTVNYMRDCPDRLIVNKLLDYPILRTLWVYHPSRKKWLSRLFAIIAPLGFPIYLVGIKSQSNLKDELRRIVTVSTEITALLEERANTNHDSHNF